MPFTVSCALYNTGQKWDHQSKFCRTDIFKLFINNMRIKLSNILPRHLRILITHNLLEGNWNCFYLQQVFCSALQSFLMENTIVYDMIWYDMGLTVRIGLFVDLWIVNILNISWSYSWPYINKQFTQSSQLTHWC